MAAGGVVVVMAVEVMAAEAAVAMAEVMMAAEEMVAEGRVAAAMMAVMVVVARVVVMVAAAMARTTEWRAFGECGWAVEASVVEGTWRAVKTAVLEVVWRDLVPLAAVADGWGTQWAEMVTGMGMLVATKLAESGVRLADKAWRVEEAGEAGVVMAGAASAHFRSYMSRQDRSCSVTHPPESCASLVDSRFGDARRKTRQWDRYGTGPGGAEQPSRCCMLLCG